MTDAVPSAAKFVRAVLEDDLHQKVSDAVVRKVAAKVIKTMSGRVADRAVNAEEFEWLLRLLKESRAELLGTIDSFISRETSIGKNILALCDEIEEALRLRA